MGDDNIVPVLWVHRHVEVLIESANPVVLTRKKRKETVVKHCERALMLLQK